jgi:DNA-binding transcriptional LysR family regulator
MARVDRFTGLSEFLAVANHASFRAAAAEIGVTSAAVSQAVRALEARLGLLLFQRTTRNVALTEAGARLLSQLSPAATQIGDALEALGALRERPIGNLRLSVPHIAMDLVLLRVLPEFRKSCPDVTVEIDVNDASIDLNEQRFDAGIRIGEFVERDMVAVRVTPDFRWLVVGAPSYFAAHGRPQSPQELTKHECIRYRFPTAQTVYRWQFQRRGREFSLEPAGAIVVNDHLAMIALAKRGLGLAYTADLVAAQALASGELEGILAPSLPTKPGLFLYFPAKSQTQPKLRAFIDLMRRLVRDGSPPPSGAKPRGTA